MNNLSKKLSLILCLILLVQVVSGQTIGRQLFGSGGSNSVPLNATYYVSWSMGEPVVHTIDSSLPQLTQGFQQPETVLPLHPHAIELQGKVRMNDAWLSWSDNLEGNHQYIIQFWKQGWKNLDSIRNRTYKHTNAQGLASENKLRYRVLVAGPDGRIRASNSLELVFQSETEPLVFPNPTRDIVTVANLQGKATIHVLNAEGKRILTKNIQTELFQLDLGSSTAGIYFLLIEGENGVMFRRKIQKL